MTIRDELAAINAGFGEAFATQDAERLAAFCADDARLLFHGQPVIRGREAIDAICARWSRTARPACGS